MSQQELRGIGMVHIYRAARPSGWRPAIEAPMLSAGEIGGLVRRALVDARAGRAYGSKLVVTPGNDELCSLVGHRGVADSLDEERLNWKLSALIGIGESAGAVKLVGSNAYNRLSGLPRSQSTVVLFDKLSMRPLCVMDGTDLSAARTGAYASIVTDLFRPDARSLRIFVIGTGAVARYVVRDLQAHTGSRIECLHVRGRTAQSGEDLISECGGLCDFPLRRADNLSAMPECDLVITATNAAKPVFQAADVGPHTVVAHFGGDETPAEFIETVLERGTAICDDAISVGRRNSQSLALYFSRSGRSLADEAGRLGILDLLPDMRLPETATRSPALVTCVGLPVLDLYLAQRMYQVALERAETQGG